MRRFKYTLKSVCIGLLFSLFCLVPVMADDTEIYTSLGTVTVKPNVLFILDNSASMSSNTVPNIKQRFNAINSYIGCFDGSKVYYSTDGSQPVCGSVDYFNLSDLHCDHANDEYNASGSQISSNGPLEAWGTYADQMSQHSTSNVWSTITVNNRAVECAQDQGIHGSNSSPASGYIVNAAAGWQSTATNPSVWSGGKNNYTLYHGNYLNYLMDTSVGNLGTDPTRFAEVTRAINALIDTNTSINVGLLAFDEFTFWPVDSGTNKIDGGDVVYPMEDINTARTGFKSALSGINANTGTPLSEAYFEALRYFGGMSVHYGVLSQPPSVAASQSGGSYISPITNECQKNSIIVLTDGLPTEDNLTTGELDDLPGYTDMSCSATAARPPADPNCLDELAAWASNPDNDVLAGTGPAQKGKQNITTHTVGFANASLSAPGTLIVNTAAAGGGQFVTADNADTLRSEISKLFAAELNVNTTFSSPAVSVNAFNRSTHLDDLYFTLFEPANYTHWPGNFKKYKLDFFIDSTDVDGDNDFTERLPFIADKTGANAVDPATGFFATGAESDWSGIVDGASVSAGGAANEFTTARKVYTYTDTYTNTNGVFTPGVSSAVLTASSNAVDKSNAAITEAMLDIVGDADKITGTPRIETLLDWSAGIDVLDEYPPLAGTTTDARLGMGDPLHSEPALVQYGGTPTAPDLVAYVATNDGYLHAIDADDGKELFSFIPKELLPNLNGLMDNTSGIKTYGLDGNVVAWVNDTNGDGIISGGSEHVYLYIGMRRGGKNIYSLDVTDRNSPILRWVIKGGSGDYAELSQTWSTVNVEKIKDGATEKAVLIFGGGYDPDQDNATVRTADDDGNAIFIADADSGQLLWSGGNGGTQTVAGMDYSIPARVKPLDMKGDGLIDRLYVADVGGQIFRFDIDNDNGSALASSITGGRIADLAGAGTANARRFYYPPDVALIAKRGEAAYLALVVASGYRAHPLDTEVQDRIYLLKDNDVYNIPATYKTLTEAGSTGIPALYDATLNLVAGNGSTAQNDIAKTALDNSSGWYIKLDDGTNTNTWIGEKGLSEALLIEGVAVVTTYIPTPLSATTTSCTPPEGNGRVYFLDVLDGSAALPSNLDVRIDRHKDLARSGIPPAPNVIITKGGEPTLCIGTECEAAGFGLGARKTYWYEVEN